MTTLEINEKKDSLITALGSVFFAPNYVAMKPYMIEAYKSFSFTLDATPESIVMRIIAKYYNDYNNHCSLANSDKWGKQQGDFNLQLMLKHAECFVKKMRLAEFFNRPSFFGICEINAKDKHLPMYKHNYKAVNCSHIDKDIFAVALGTEAIVTSDNDCYETAGGYRGYKSAENPIVYLKYAHNGIYLVFDSSLMVDHYNNNFFGVSTGNGTTKYKEGENVITRSIATNSFDVSEVLTIYNLTLKKMDVERGKASLKDYININS